MVGCSFKTEYLGGEWNCPLKAVSGEEYCFWHKEEEGKKPIESQLQELKESDILGVYLKKANLKIADLEGAFLTKANLEEAKLNMGTLKKAKLNGATLKKAILIETNLQKANLEGANLEEADLWEVNLQGAKLDNANLQKATLAKANLKKADLRFANLTKAQLSEANLSKADLNDANLTEAKLWHADLGEVELSGATLQKAILFDVNLQEATLLGTNLQEANLESAKLEGASLYGAMFDSKTVLKSTYLVGSNLYRSYFDEAKSFRNAIAIEENIDREINEVVGDAINGSFLNYLGKFIEYSEKLISKIIFYDISRITLKIPRILFSKIYLLDFWKIDKSKITDKIKRKGFVRYVIDADCVVFFDASTKCLIKNPENKKRNKDDFVKIEGLENLLFENGKIKEKYLYKENRAMLYEASYEVYNNLYNFYIANGRLDQAAYVHYRRGEVHRKLRWEDGGVDRLRSIFDYLVLKGLTGYGDRLGRPVWFSGFVIILFAALFWFFDGIVKNVNGITVKPDVFDYLYHSITTFTSLGYSNIQPNLASGHIPQLLVAMESGLGVTMIALIIFVITYQVSR